MKLSLKKHQLDALDFLEFRRSAGLFYQMRLGKSLITLEHLHRMSRKDMMFPCLIVGPLSGVSVWRGECEKFGYEFSIQELVGDLTTRVCRLNTPADIYVVNYEGMRILALHLKAKGFKSIVFDESHRLADRKSQQTKVASELCNLIPYRYLLTGTPVTKSPESLWSQMNMIEPGCLGNFYAFAARYIDYKSIKIKVGTGLREIRKPQRFKNLEELKNRLQQYSIRRTQAECLDDLPEKSYNVIKCHMTPEQKKHYYSLKLGLATVLEDEQFKVTHAATLMQKLQQVCQGFIYDNDGKTTVFKSGKRELLLDLLKDMSGEKIVLFTWFKADIDILQKELSDKYKVLVYGGSSDDRIKCATEFRESKEPCIFLSNVEAAKEAIDLSSSSTIIYYGNSWSYVTREQSEARIQGMNQTKRNIVYYDFVVPGTIDELVHKSLEYKEEVADRITGDTKRLAEMILKQGEIDG